MYYREHFLTTHLLLSKDLMGSIKRKEQRQQELLRLALQMKHSVVIDNTNPTPLERVPLIEIAHSYGAAAIGYYFVATTRQAIARNAQRTPRVPSAAIYSTASRLIPPAYAEGFDTLYYVRIAEHSTQLAPAWQIEEIRHGE